MKLWSSQLWEQFLQLRREAWKIQDFNGVWTRDLAIPVRRSNQLSYEATDVGSWSFVGSNGPVRNESMMKWYMKWIIHELRIWNQVNGFEPRWSPEFFRLLYAIAKIALITAKIIASLDFISAVNLWFISYTISSLVLSLFLFLGNGSHTWFIKKLGLCSSTSTTLILCRLALLVHGESFSSL